jgi:hypothetical protein
MLCQCHLEVLKILSIDAPEPLQVLQQMILESHFNLMGNRGVRYPKVDQI